MGKPSNFELAINFFIHRSIFGNVAAAGYNIQQVSFKFCSMIVQFFLLSRPVDFLTVLVNVVKFNAPYLDKEVLIQLVQ